MVFLVPNLWAQEAEKTIQKELIIVKHDLRNVGETTEKVKAIIRETIELNSIELDEETLKELEKELSQLQERIKIETKIGHVDGVEKRIEKIIVLGDNHLIEGDEILKACLVKDGFAKDLEKDIIIKIEKDENGNIVKKKWVDGKKVPFTDEEMEMIHFIKGDENVHEVLRTINISTEDTVSVFDTAENPNIKAFRFEYEIETDGGNEFIIHKWVDGEKVELTEEEKEKMKKGNPFMVIDKIPFPPHAPSIERVNVPNYEGLHIDSNMTVDEVNGKELSVLISPNPSNGSIQYQFSSERTNNLEVKILNQNGQVIKKLKRRNLTGDFQHEFNLKGKASGVYLVQTIFGNALDVSRVIIQ